MASSTEEMSAANNDASGGSRRDDAATEFGVFKDFDFLEYESESIEVIFCLHIKQLFHCYRNTKSRAKVRTISTGA